MSPLRGVADGDGGTVRQRHAQGGKGQQTAPSGMHSQLVQQ